jgi:hypothetical protein
MTDEELLEHRKAWRHMLQAAFAEQEARQRYHAGPSQRVSAAEQALLTQGLRLDAAIDALDASLLHAPSTPEAEEYSTTTIRPGAAEGDRGA